LAWMGSMRISAGFGWDRGSYISGAAGLSGAASVILEFLIYLNSTVSIIP
jgi:hypothetical protein